MLKDKVVLITGANGGLGRAVGRAFLDAGARVAGTAPNIEQSEFSDPTFLAMSAEISSAAQAKALVDAVLARCGQLDAVVHLVGGFTGGKTVAETDDATLDRMFEVNFRTAFHVIQAALPVMQARRSGRILAIGSRTAIEPAAGVGAYSASKAALVSLIGTVAHENKDLGITANVILPGTMDTPGNRLAMPGADASRWVQPSQVAALLVHLVSDAAQQVTGAVIPIYGSQI
jgi:NAD(P)-dependent dehydrogenase (short-subunit alcohol dehydrogenase family)